MAERATSLLETHKKLGARLTEFAGWEMPLQYKGVVAEHNAVRNAAGLFDVSHLGKLLVSGSGGGEGLQHALTADVQGLQPGEATYALALTDEGGAIDDVFVYRLSDDTWMVVPNAANNSAVASSIADSGAKPEEAWDRWAILALQGPRSFVVFEEVFGDTDALRLKLHELTGMEFGGEAGWVARTGYTGERGFELYVPVSSAPEVFERLLEAGAAPVGLGARDTLRLEMGYALYGHELTLDINPLEAGLSWAIAWDTDFRGKEALEKVREEGRTRRLFGVVSRDKGVPRQGHRVLRDASEIGTLTSGNYSPTLGTGIGLALGPVDSTPEEGSDVSIDTGRRALVGTIVKPPFVKRGSSG